MTLELAILKEADSPTQNKIAALVNLELELWKANDSEDDLDKKILETIFQTFMLPNTEYRKAALQMAYRTLALNVPADDKAAAQYREQLMKNVLLPEKQTLMTALGELQGNPDLTVELEWMKQFMEGL